MTTITLEEAQTRFAEIVNDLQPGEEVQITSGDEPVAKIVGQRKPERKPRKAGSAKDQILYMADDFDAPMELVDAK